MVESEHLLTGGWSFSRSVQVFGVNPLTAFGFIL